MIYNVVNILTAIFESILVFMLFNTFLKKRDNVPQYIYIISPIMLSVLINISNNIFHFGLFNPLIMMLLIFLVSLMYSTNIRVQVLISILSILLLAITEIIVLFIITLVMGLTVEQATLIDEYRFLGIVLSKTLAFVVFKLICIRYHRNRFVTKWSYWILFLLNFTISMLAVFLIFTLQYESENTYLYNLSVVCSFGLLYSTFFSLYLYEHIAEQSELENRQKMLSQQITAQANHLNDILITQKQLKSFRHDLSNHLIALKACIENDNTDDGVSYINKLNQIISSGKAVVETGNAALDAIINTKTAIANSKGIEVVTSIQIPEDLFVDAVDICIIFGNALDNAIEACERASSDKKYIKIHLVFDDNSVVCKISNTSENQHLNLKTTKKDSENHGFGIESIKKCVEKYDGVCNFQQSNNEFSISFVMFCKD